MTFTIAEGRSMTDPLEAAQLPALRLKRNAMTLRDRLYPAPYYRLVYGESDGLPGLVVDRYGASCVVQIGTAGMERLKPQIQEALIQVVECESRLFKNDSGAREMEGLPSYVEAVTGS